MLRSRSIRIAKLLAPWLTRISSPRIWRAVEIYAAVLQGKGAGTGWDMQGEIRAAQRFIPAHGPVIFDVGAHHGDWTKQIAAIVMGPARFFLFEPQDDCQRYLHDLPDSSVLIRDALSDSTQDGVLYMDVPGSGAASLLERRDTYFSNMTANTQAVSTRTLDAVIDEHSISHIDLLKLDIEGAEMMALRGAARALERDAITTIAFEFGSANLSSRTTFRDFWDLLVGRHGFSVWRISPGGNLVPQNEYSEEQEHYRGVSNYIASRIGPRK